METILSDTNLDIQRLRVSKIRSLSPLQKMELLSQMNQSVLLLAQSGLRRQYPQDSEERIHFRLACLRLGRELAEKLYSAG
ncbi:MAG: hypothetical protein GYA58_12820 [Anaerolineaceae bacterium]|jgi:hypothetical protein|nr:hypothetical protein [Anaerolineaceae bacterium]